MTGPNFVAAIHKCRDKVSRVKLFISIPVTTRPTCISGDTILVFASHEGSHEIRGVEFAVEICVDEIDQLGQFIELEITSDLRTLEQTKAALLSLADRLQLARPEKRSYLELLMSQLGPQQVG